MDVISFSEAATANGRIEKTNANPDSDSGILTQPMVIATGESVTIPAGRVAVLPNAVVNGEIVINGELFIPSGATSSSIDSQLALKAPLANPVFTGAVVLPSATSIGSISNTEISYLDGVTSGLQEQLNTKAGSASPIFTGTPTAPTAIAGTNTTQLATTAFVNAKSELDSIGVGQTWQIVTGGRAINTTYTNTTGKPIVVDVSISKTNSGDYGYIESESKHISKKQFEGGGQYAYNFQAIIRDGLSYRLVIGGGINAMLEWHELR